MINLSSTLDEASCEKFYNQLSEAASHRSIKCPPPIIYKECDTQRYSVDKVITILKDMIAESNDCHFFIIILPDNSSIQEQLYGEVKKLVRYLLLNIHF